MDYFITQIKFPYACHTIKEDSHTHDLWPWQELTQGVKAHQSEVDRFADEGQMLVETTSEGRVSTYVQQMSSRYQALLGSAKVSSLF